MCSSTEEWPKLLFFNCYSKTIIKNSCSLHNSRPQPNWRKSRRRSAHHQMAQQHIKKFEKLRVLAFWIYEKKRWKSGLFCITENWCSGFSFNNRPKTAENTSFWHHALKYHPFSGIQLQFITVRQILKKGFLKNYIYLVLKGMLT